MQPASNLLIKSSHRLFADTTAQAQFVEALTHPQPFHPSILWCRAKPDDFPFTTEPPLPWQPEFVDRLAIATKPGQHPLHQAGYYYCLDFSSVFAASVLLAIAQPTPVIVDMCASPGGKSLFAWRALQPQRLISNEVIGKRIGALLSNLKRCQNADWSESPTQQIISNIDSKILAEEIPQSADLVIVDAPCTGQSLLAKNEKNPGCFHPVTIKKNANRQKRILANSAQLVAPRGYLAYMTCAYSPEENEQVSEWFLKHFSHFAPIPIAHLSPYQSHLTDLPCYRMFPQDKLGAGAFTILFQNTQTQERNSFPDPFLQRAGLIKLALHS
ncbi:RsmB/NOP family class I SAM-dependent RNA methyltransferase [Oscillatoria sp. FACHB-1407]|uniref:RsmB/NOP family class I SAM-dependent RNA methyltransferase n=1 Tax=Oscillatoria sp. FACHB-1407 TaxID=2692847 RepID=UPI0016878510|nr:RsmB/NOP family class I SAM-dependent RNA methyltransferase [Oscillatoria sp. FACHB-1407]MBD2461704.1 RsmB/NOP family class I SAM-dependent RNA methyltransferase [Oscillatoria sp. FACHB-1407]